MNTAFLEEINWVAVFLAALAYFILGALWYSKLLFVRPWLAYTQIDANEADAKKGMGIIMTGSFLLMFVCAAGLAILVNRLEIQGWMSGVKLGLLSGLFFGVTSISVSYLYEKRPVGLHLINGGYTVVGNIIAAVIVCCWQ